MARGLRLVHPGTRRAAAAADVSLVDEQSKQSEILQSTCVALVSLIGFSDNSMDDNGFYDSIWKQLERFSNANGITLVHTVLYNCRRRRGALHAHSRHLRVASFLVRRLVREDRGQDQTKKKKKRKRILQSNCVRVWRTTTWCWRSPASSASSRPSSAR